MFPNVNNNNDTVQLKLTLIHFCPFLVIHCAYFVPNSALLRRRCQQWIKNASLSKVFRLKLALLECQSGYLQVYSCSSIKLKVWDNFHGFSHLETFGEVRVWHFGEIVISFWENCKFWGTHRGWGVNWQGRGIGPDRLMTPVMHGHTMWQSRHGWKREAALPPWATTPSYLQKLTGDASPYARVNGQNTDGLSARLDKSLHEPVGSQHLHKSNSVSCQGGEIVAGQSLGLVRLRGVGGGGGPLQVDALFHALQWWQHGWQMELLFLFKYGIWSKGMVARNCCDQGNRDIR